jgi:CDP-2,3-bis-(O-geranylgeranyl)-sn-glycerol synthase
MPARWVLLPVIGAPIAHAPVLRWQLLRRLNRPIDGGRTLRGRRVLGDNKTWRGAVVMSCGAFATTLGARRCRWYRDRLPAEVRDAPPAAQAAALAVGVVVGELPNSLLKRQLGIAPGSQRRSAAGVALSVFDQADFVPVTVLLLRPAWRMPLRQALDAFATVAVAHACVNVVGYAIGARETLV